MGFRRVCILLENRMALRFLYTTSNDIVAYSLCDELQYLAASLQPTQSQVSTDLGLINHYFSFIEASCTQTLSYEPLLECEGCPITNINKVSGFISNNSKSGSHESVINQNAFSVFFVLWCALCTFSEGCLQPQRTVQLACRLQLEQTLFLCTYTSNSNVQNGLDSIAAKQQ